MGATQWAGFEYTRTLFARRDSDVPPVVTDSEVIIMLDGGGRVAEGAQPDQVTGRLRIADYMTPQDNLYFEARNRAVSISDYDVLLERL